MLPVQPLPAQPSDVPAAQSREAQSRAAQPQGAQSQAAEFQSWDRPCPRCGGSGVLRLDRQRWRTCLDCLGQGRITLLRPATTTAALHQPEVPASAPLTAPPVSAPAPLSDPVSSAAR